MVKDFSARLFSKLFYFSLKLNSFFSTTYMNLYCKLAGIHLDSGCTFYGKSTMLRANNSIIHISKNCRFRSTVSSNLIGINHRCIITTLQPNSTIEIGENCGFSGTVIGASISISLGKNVRCGANTLITDSDWHPDDPRVGPAKPISIEDNVWLGYGSIVMKGVTIGKNTVIGAGSIVTKNIPENVIAAGNPCKVIKKLSA